MNKKEQRVSTKRCIKDILKAIEIKAIANIDKAISCGALDEDSDFLKDNRLLAIALVSDASLQFKIKDKDYKKEESNLLKFI